MAKSDFPLTRTETLLDLAQKDGDEEVREAAQLVREGTAGIIMNMKHGIRNRFMQWTMMLPTNGSVDVTMDLTKQPAEHIAEYDAETFLLAGMMDGDKKVARACGVLFDEAKRILEAKTTAAEKPTIRRPNDPSASDSVQSITT